MSVWLFGLVVGLLGAARGTVVVPPPGADSSPSEIEPVHEGEDAPPVAFTAESALAPPSTAPQSDRVGQPDPFPVVSAAPEARPASQEEPPAAAPERTFGDKGEIVLYGLLNGSLGHLGYSSSSASTNSATVEPGFDYFVGRNVSLGAAAFLQYGDSTSSVRSTSRFWAYGMYGRVGGNVALGRAFSWRPIGSLGVWAQKTKLTAPGPGYTTGLDGIQVAGNNDYTSRVVVVEVFAPLLVHPASHFFVGLGPDIYTDLSHQLSGFSNKRTFVGLSSVVGGWF
jgi:hypothetical protein